MAVGRSVSGEANQVFLASEMIRLGARLQLLQAETTLSHERLTRLYHEIQGRSPQKGMLPFSARWFTMWLPNIHASLFYSIYEYIDSATPTKKLQALIEAYRLYLEQAIMDLPPVRREEVPVVSFTRAWVLVRFVESGLLRLTDCSRCGGRFITAGHGAPTASFICGICKPPPRAGKRVAHRHQAATHPAHETLARRGP